MVLQMMVWFWIHFEQIFHTSPTACKRLIGSRPHICFPPPIRMASFLPLTKSKPVGMLQSCIPGFPFHGSTYIHAPRGATEVQALLPCSGTTPPSHSPLSSNQICASESSNTLAPCTCRSHSCRPMIFAAFDIKAYSPKLLSNNERRKPTL